MNIIAIDTGKRGCGMALYDVSTKRLAQCAYVTSDEPDTAERETFHDVTAKAAVDWLAPLRLAMADIIIEFPRIYRNREQEKDQNDLLDLAAVAGGIIQGHAERGLQGFPRYVHVSDWKGQLTKAQAWHHISKRLVPAELLIYELAVAHLPKALHHNVQDAVGIGLWACGRFK